MPYAKLASIFFRHQCAWNSICESVSSYTLSLSLSPCSLLTLLLLLSSSKSWSKFHLFAIPLHFSSAYLRINLGNGHSHHGLQDILLWWTDILPDFIIFSPLTIPCQHVSYSSFSPTIITCRLYTADIKVQCPDTWLPHQLIFTSDKPIRGHFPWT